MSNTKKHLAILKVKKSNEIDNSGKLYFETVYNYMIKNKPRLFVF